MRKLWQADDAKTPLADAAEKLNSSISFDKRLFKDDIAGSVAHARMLGECGIIAKDQADFLISSLHDLERDVINGNVKIDESAEDIHSFVESELVSRIGDAAKTIHTARSRNDQCVLDLRLWLSRQNDKIVRLVKDLADALVSKAEENMTVIMPGFTHLQHAQPLLFSHWLMAYAWMALRDGERFVALKKAIRRSPIGSCALAGTSFPVDRNLEARLLHMDEPVENSLDAVSDRDFAIEFIFACSLLMMHLSRLCEEIVIFSSAQYSFLHPSDGYSTGSSIMPQKRNPDMAELIRGKTGRVYGDLMALLSVMKSLPLAYNKDMQEDKEAVFDAADTVELVLTVTPGMVRSLIVNRQAMLDSAQKGYMNATDMADYLVRRGMAFRDAYGLCRSIVEYAAKSAKPLEGLSLEELKAFSPLFGEDVYEAISIRNCVERRTSSGGTATGCVRKEIALMKERISKLYL